MDDLDFLSEFRVGRGHWVGMMEHVGDTMTFKVLTNNPNQIICCSKIRPADSLAPNYRLDPLCRGG